MYGVILGIHVLVCVSLMVVVLLQSGKGGGLAGAFGGSGGVGAVFGGQSAANFLTRATRYLAIGFMITSLSMALLVRGRFSGTVEEGLQGMQAAPATAVDETTPIQEGLPPAAAEQIPVAPEDQGN